MSDDYSAPRIPETSKGFAVLLTGIALILIGAVLINQGMGKMSSRGELWLGTGLLVAGVLFIFAGVMKIWPRKTMYNLLLVTFGILLLIGSGGQLAVDWRNAFAGLVLTGLGLLLIIIGAQVTREGWKRYVRR